MSRFIKSFIASLGLFSSAHVFAGPMTPLAYSLNSSPWAYWDDTGTQLTDGLYNAIIPSTNLGVPDAYNWVGWAGNNPSITFNFGQVVTINSVSLSTVRWEPAGVYLPSQVTINSNTFSVAGLFPDMNKAVLTFGGSWTGSTLNLDLARGSTWTFLDEVSFDGYVGAPTQQPTQGVPDSGTMLSYLMIGATALGIQAFRSRRALRRAG